MIINNYLNKYFIESIWNVYEMQNVSFRFLSMEVSL